MRFAQQIQKSMPGQKRAAKGNLRPIQLELLA
jgi:hypothetical protein